MATFVNDILFDVSYVLIDPVVNTTLNTPVAAPGAATITPASMVGIYNGAKMIAGAGLTAEVITASNVTAATFDATFANAHLAAEALAGATFPAGQTDHPLFTQDEVLGYFADVQTTFLVGVQHIFGAGTVNLQTGVRVYDAPVDAVRIEHVDIEGSPLWNTSQQDLDFEDPTWESSQAANVPTYYYQDKLNNAKVGFKPTPQVNDTANLWYSQQPGVSGLSGAQGTVTLLDQTFVHEVFNGYLKYGVLARCFSKDGEQRDDAKAQYCQKRFDLGVELGRKFMGIMEQKPNYNAPEK